MAGLILLAGLFVLPRAASAQIKPSVEILEDPTASLTSQTANISKNWKHFGSATPNLGYSRSTHWVRFDLEAPAAGEYIIEVAYPLIDLLECTILRANSESVETQGRLRSQADRLPLFHLSLAEKEKVRVIMRVQSDDSITFPVRIYTPQEHEHEQNTRQFLFGLYYGVIAVMILYNLFLYYFVRDQAYLYYVLTLVLLHGLFQLALNGFARMFLGSELLWWKKGAIVFFHSAGVLAAILFCRVFLLIPRVAKKWDYIARAIIVWGALNMLISFFDLYRLVILSTVGLGILGIVFALASGIIAMRRGYRPARFYLLAWSALLFGGFIYVLKIFGIIPSYWLTEYGVQIGSAVEATLLSIALGDRITTGRQDQVKARTEMLVHKRIALLAQTELLNHLSQLDSLKSQMHSIEYEGNSLARLLENILETLRKILSFDKGFIVIADRLQKTYLRSVGSMQPDFYEKIPDDHYLHMLIKLPDALFDQVNRIVHLDRPVFENIPENSSQVTQVMKALEDTVAALRETGFSLCLPLAYEREIFGYVMLSARKSGEQYTNSELHLIDTFRPSIAMAVRNAVLYEEVVLLRGRAEQKAAKLSDVIIDMKDTTRFDLKEKALVYISHPMAEIYQTVRKYADKPQPVLISGETGTGKELIAQTIHEVGGLSREPFIPVNCAAIPASLWESEIFGHEKGAFTDAKSERAGKIEQAAGGTLFFDEIGEMPLELQAKLLRLIQERKYERVGGKKSLEARCRFLFATNRDLQVMQKAGTFREDLYYRISVFQIVLPPLRERREDIPVLVNFFIRKYAAEMQVPVSHIEKAAMESLTYYDWPGNIRELENCVIQTLVNSTSDTIRVEDIPGHLSSRGQVVSKEALRTWDPDMDFRELDAMVSDYTRQVMIAAIQRCAGNKQEAAKLLGVKRATFYYRLKELGIQ